MSNPEKINEPALEGESDVTKASHDALEQLAEDSNFTPAERDLIEAALRFLEKTENLDYPNMTAVDYLKFLKEIFLTSDGIKILFQQKKADGLLHEFTKTPSGQQALAQFEAERINFLMDKENAAREKWEACKKELGDIKLLFLQQKKADGLLHEFTKTPSGQQAFAQFEAKRIDTLTNQENAARETWEAYKKELDEFKKHSGFDKSE